jgi:hypothetical protein
MSAGQFTLVIRFKSLRSLEGEFQLKIILLGSGSTLSSASSDIRRYRCHTIYGIHCVETQANIS